MKIVFILPGIGVSGGVRVTAVMANRLLNRGHNVRLLYSKSSNNPRSIIKGIRDKMIYRGASSWLDDFNGVINSFTDIKECRFEKNEIVLSVGMWASKMLNNVRHNEQKKIQYIHGATPWDENLMRDALSLPYPKIVVAQYLSKIISSSGNGDILAVIPNGIDTKEYFNSINDLSKDGVGTIYSSHPAKDPDTIIGVLRSLKLRRPDMPIRIFGTEKKPSRIEGVEYVRYPSISVAREIYSRCKVWVMASKSEGFPAPPLEAMACGCAVVATDCGGTRDIIRNGENGVLVKVGDVEGIVNSTMKLLDDNDLRCKFIVEAESTIKKFNWNNSIDLLENTLKIFS